MRSQPNYFEVFVVVVVVNIVVVFFIVFVSVKIGVSYGQKKFNWHFLRLL